MLSRWFRDWLILRPWRLRRCSSETSVNFQRTIRRYVPEDRTLHNHRCENLKFHTVNSFGDCSDWGFSCVSSVTQWKCRDNILIRSRSLPSTFFPKCCSLILPFDALNSEILTASLSKWNFSTFSLEDSREIRFPEHSVPFGIAGEGRKSRKQ
jgi:hypothetical protein